MTREEAISELKYAQAMCEFNPSTGEVGFRNDEDRKQHEAFDMAIEALDERKVELFDDGTLVVNVKEGEKVGRVLIEGDDHFGGLYYIDSGEGGEE